MRMVEYRYFLVVAWITIVGAMPFRAHGSSPDDPLLDEGLSRMASEIGKFLDEEKRPRVVIVGDFSGIPSLKASGGVELSRQLTAKLAIAKIDVSDDAETQIMGSFKTVNTKQHASDDFESLALDVRTISA